MTLEELLGWPSSEEGTGTAAGGESDADLVSTASAETLSRIEKIRAALDACHAGDPAWIVDVSKLPAPDLRMLDRLLGSGDIRITVDGEPGAQIRSSAFPGIWRVRYTNEEGLPVKTVYEVVDVPSALTEASVPGTARQRERGRGDDSSGGGAELESVVLDLEDNVRRYRPGYDTRIVNLSFLSPDDPEIRDLERKLGTGTVSIIGTGHQKCRVVSTARRNVWWARYFNPAGQLALNVLEVVDIPLVVRVTEKELLESAERLRKLLARAAL